MDRNEVLAALSRAEVDYVEVQAESQTVWGFQDAEWKATALRAAAEIIRDGGWRSLHHGLDRDTALTCGKWEELPNGKHRWYCYQQKITPGYAMALGLTHYLPEPAPPAREESKSKNGEENDRQNQDNKCIG